MTPQVPGRPALPAGHASVDSRSTASFADPSSANTLGTYLDFVGRAIAEHSDTVDPHVLHAATNLLANAARPVGVDLTITTAPERTPRIVYERTLGRLASSTIGCTVTLDRSSRGALDALLFELAHPTQPHDETERPSAADTNGRHEYLRSH